MDLTSQPDPPPSLAAAPSEPRVGTEDEQSAHREPAPKVIEHNLAFDHAYGEDYARGEGIRTGINSTSHGIR